jgi:hypothetical protein
MGYLATVHTPTINNMRNHHFACFYDALYNNLRRRAGTRRIGTLKLAAIVTRQGFSQAYAGMFQGLIASGV